MFDSMTTPGPRQRETQSQTAKRGWQTQPPPPPAAAAFLGLSHRQQTHLALALAGSDPLLPPTPRFTFCGWPSPLKSAVSLKTATGGACGTSLNMDMAQVEEDAPGAGGGDGERVLPVTGKEIASRLGKVHLQYAR